MKKAQFVNIYSHPDGRVVAFPATRTEVSVTLSDGKILELFSFTEEVLQYWRSYITSLGIRLRRQPFALLAGRDA